MSWEVGLEATKFGTHKCIESMIESEESLLYAARHGESTVVRDLLRAKKEGKLTLNVNCKGRNKSNLGWTALHLATYFGHVETVNVLLEGGVDVNAVNNVGDTALHKAAFTGKEEMVIALLDAGADVTVLNGEGRLARDVCRTHDVHRLLAAAELAGRRERELALLTAAKEGHTDVINKLLTDARPPSINCVDEQGNTSLHCAAYRGHAHVAVILLQNGIDCSARNHNGKLALELAKDARMREVLSVQPVRRLQRQAARFEGALMKKSRFLGWRPVWAVLQRGVLVYYLSRAEAAAAGESRGRRDRKYLDAARVVPPATDAAILHVTFSDGDTHRLAVPRGEASARADVLAARQNWITAFNEHIAYSGHYLWAGGGVSATEMALEADETELDKPLGSMNDALTTATNCLALLDSQLQECDTIVKALEKNIQVGTTLHQSAYMRFQHALDTGQRSLSTLRHVAALVGQAREAQATRLRAETEKNRVLEQALAALARQHHELEMSVAEEMSGSKRKKKQKQKHKSTESFYDAYEGESDSDTLVTAGLHSPLGALSPWDDSPDTTPRGDRTPTGPRREDPSVTKRLSSAADAMSSLESLHSALSPATSLATSLGTLVSQDGHVYRNARSHVGLHRPSSLWSI